MNTTTKWQLHEVLDGQQYHEILDSLIAGYMSDNSGTTPSSISAMDLLEWHYKKFVEDEKK